MGWLRFLVCCKAWDRGDRERMNGRQPPWVTGPGVSLTFTDIPLGHSVEHSVCVLLHVAGHSRPVTSVKTWGFLGRRRHPWSVLRRERHAKPAACERAPRSLLGTCAAGARRDQRAPRTCWWVVLLVQVRVTVHPGGRFVFLSRSTDNARAWNFAGCLTWTRSGSRRRTDTSPRLKTAWAEELCVAESRWKTVVARRGRLLRTHLSVFSDGPKVKVLQKGSALYK